MFILVTVGCLILRQRYQRRNDTISSYSSLIPSTVESASRLTTGRNVVDVEDLVSPARTSSLNA